MRRAPFAFGLLVLASAAMAQTPTASLGVSVNAYYLDSAKLRSAFGDPAITYGVNLSAVNRPQANKPTFAYNIVTATKGDNKFFLLPATIGYEVQFADRSANVLPYARVEGGYAYYDVAIHHDDFDKSFKAGGFAGAVEAGLVFNKAIAVKARYNLFQERFGVNLSGLEVGLVYTFGKL